MSTKIVKRHIDSMRTDYRCTIRFCKVAIIALIGTGFYIGYIAIEHQDWLKLVYEALIVPSILGLMKLHSWETRNYVDFASNVSDAQRIANNQSTWARLIRLSRIGT